MAGWLFTSVSGETSWQSNAGYEDVLGSQYVYDSGVAYHKQVVEGDVAVIREANTVLGISRVDRIDSSLGEKLRRRCPECSRTGVEYRKRAGEYTCRYCPARFPEPVEKLEPVTDFVANYESRWQAIDGALTMTDLEPILAGVDQNSIRPCDIDGLSTLLANISTTLPPSTAPAFSPHIDGGRRRAEVLSRIGQNQFRKALLRAHGLECAVTGPCPAEALEAAHILPYSEHEKHSLDGGLLLRTDIHRLFDADALSINPETLCVELDTGLLQYPGYASLQGQKITQTPSIDALRARYKLT